MQVLRIVTRCNIHIKLEHQYIMLNIMATILIMIFTGISTKQSQLLYSLLYASDILISMAAIVFLFRYTLSCWWTDLIIFMVYLASSIITMELVIEAQQDKQAYLIFQINRTVVTALIARTTYFKFIILLFSNFLLCARFQLYTDVYPYLGFVFIVTIYNKWSDREILQQQAVLDNLLNVVQEVTSDQFIVIDQLQQNIVFQTKQFQKEYKYNWQNDLEFRDCLMQFQSAITNQTVSSVIETLQSNQGSSKDLRFQPIYVECLENCEYREEKQPTINERRNNLANNLEPDEVNENKHDNECFQREMESPHPHQYNCIKPSIFNQNFSEESPKSDTILRSACKFFGKNKSQAVQILKQKKLNIIFTQCYWNQRLSIVIVLQDLIRDSEISVYKSQIDHLSLLNQNKDQILASVFHDFKTPINGIVAIIEALEDKKEVTANTQYYLKIIRKNIDLMLYMIHDILDYARIQQNTLRLCLSDFYINEIIDEVIELITIQAQQKGIALLTNYEIPTFQMHSDPNRIKQILMNIVSNSLKFTDKGSITIEVKSTVKDKTNQIYRSTSSKNLCSNRNLNNNNNISGFQLRKQLSGKSIHSIGKSTLTYMVSVTDTGCGISELVRPKLFNMFATFGAKNVPNQFGTGIGLMVCKKLVALLGPNDKIYIESEEGVGTTMSFQIYSSIMTDKASPNYISVFKQEVSSQKMINMNESKEMGDQQQQFVRSTQLRIFKQEQGDKQETSYIEQNDVPAQEDMNQSKEINLGVLRGQKRKFTKSLHQSHRGTTVQMQEDPSQDLQIPSVRLHNFLRKKKIGLLIVDDEPFNVMAIKLLLQDFSSNITFIEAYNGMQAINKLHSQQVSDNITHIFMDLNMPILNGWQATKQIRQLISLQELNHVNIIALTGFDDQQQQEMCEQYGFDAFITKPVSLEVIAEVFAQLDYIQ